MILKQYENWTKKKQKWTKKRNEQKKTIIKQTILHNVKTVWKKWTKKKKWTKQKKK